MPRDAYDRAVRQARGRARTRLTPAPARPRRPDQQVYRPHRGSGERCRHGVGVPQVSGAVGCCWWESRGIGDIALRPNGYHRAGAPWGAVHRGCVGQWEVTRRVCARSTLEPPLRRALCQRVQDELSKRRGTG
ncbi:CB068 protein, partial [Hylia prasina]|nr:CB068 protein [Hylia prasina]